MGAEDSIDAGGLDFRVFLPWLGSTRIQSHAAPKWGSVLTHTRIRPAASLPFHVSKRNEGNQKLPIGRNKVS